MRRAIVFPVIRAFLTQVFDDGIRSLRFFIVVEVIVESVLLEALEPVLLGFCHKVVFEFTTASCHADQTLLSAGVVVLVVVVVVVVARRKGRTDGNDSEQEEHNAHP